MLVVGGEIKNAIMHTSDVIVIIGIMEFRCGSLTNNFCGFRMMPQICFLIFLVSGG